MKNIFAIENIGAQVFSFLEKSEKTVGREMYKAIHDIDRTHAKMLLKYYGEIFSMIKGMYSTGRYQNKEIRLVLHNLINYANDHDIKFGKLVHIALRFRFIIIEKLLTEKYDIKKILKIRNSIVTCLDDICSEMYDYAFDIQKKHLREAEARYKKMIGTIQEGLISLSKDMKVTFCNKTICKMLKATREELLHKPIKDFISEITFLEIQKNIKSLKKQTLNEEPFEIEYTYVDGEVRFFEITPSLLYENNKPSGLQATVRDITEKVLLEKKLAERYEKMQMAYLELGKVNRQMASLIDVSSIASTNLKPNEIFSFILSSIAILSEADSATLRVYNESKNTLTMVAIHKMQTLWENMKTIPTRGTYSGDALKKGHPVIINDLREIRKTRYIEQIIKSGLYGMYSSPLVVGGKAIGVLNLYSVTPGKFNDLNQDLIAALVGQAGLAVKLYT